MVARITSGLSQPIAATSLREVLQRLNQGGVLIIAPEGTRSKTGGLLPGKPGTTYLAAKTGVPVLPVGIVGSEDGFTAQNADTAVVIPPLNPARRTPHTEGLAAVIWHLIVSHPALKVTETKWESVR